MNISIYMNDGSEISSIDINDATSEEALAAIKAFGFGENEEEEGWLYSDNQKIRYRVEDSDKIRIEDLADKYEKLKKTNEILRIHCTYYKTRYRSCVDAVNEWKDKYAAECQNNDEIKKAYDKLTKNFKALINNRDEWIDTSNMFEKAYRSADMRCLELREERDNLKVEYEKMKALCDKIQDERDNLIEERDPQDGLCSL